MDRLTGQTDRQTDHSTPCCACARGNWVLGTVHAQAAATETLLCSDDGDFSMASQQLKETVEFVKL